MSIADDGIGLPRSAQAPERHSPGLGLVTMRERAQAVGGAFKVEALPDGGGTRLTVRVAL
jgi:signal transduction histidine kinase